ncbi:MAG: HNH endonuclease signature motif containing protein [Bryobacteraceae bacterium]
MEDIVIKKYFSEDFTTKDYCTCKICGKYYPVNFIFHIRKYHGLSKLEYNYTFYKAYIPRCIETGDISNNPIKNYNFGWNCINIEYKKLQRRIECLMSSVKRRNIDLKEMTFKYWIFEKGLKASEAYNKINFLLYNDRWKGLLDEFYDDTWTNKGKLEYKGNLLSEKNIQLYHKNTDIAWIQRGWGNPKEKKKEWLIKTGYKYNSCWSNPDIQRSNSKKYYDKHSKLEIRKSNWWCKEYWIERGLTESESINKIKELNLRDKKYFIDKYGFDKGMILYQQRIDKWLNTLKNKKDYKNIVDRRTVVWKKIGTLEDCIKNFGELEGRIKYAKKYWHKDIFSIMQFEDYKKFYDLELRKKIFVEQQCKCGNFKCENKKTKIIYHLHHIDYNKKNNDRRNLIFLCNKCHSGTNNIKNRIFWIDYYKDINNIFCGDM